MLLGSSTCLTPLLHWNSFPGIPCESTLHAVSPIWHYEMSCQRPYQNTTLIQWSPSWTDGSTTDIRRSKPRSNVYIWIGKTILICVHQFKDHFLKHVVKEFSDRFLRISEQRNWCKISGAFLIVLLWDESPKGWINTLKHDFAMIEVLN